MSAIGNIENAILDAVNAALLTPGYLRDTGSVGGGWTGRALSRALQFSPAVYVGYAGSKSVGSDGTAPSVFAVWVVTKGPLETERRDGPRIVGAYAIIDVMVPLLNNLNTDAGTGRVVKIENLFEDAALDAGGTVYALFVEFLSLPFPPSVDECDLDELLHIHADIDAPPMASAAEHEKWLHGDYSTSKPDADLDAEREPDGNADCNTDNNEDAP